MEAMMTIEATMMIGTMMKMKKMTITTMKRRRKKMIETIPATGGTTIEATLDPTFHRSLARKIQEIGKTTRPLNQKSRIIQRSEAAQMVGLSPPQRARYSRNKASARLSLHCEAVTERATPPSPTWPQLLLAAQSASISVRF
jgi:hypothetical protein